MKILALDLGKYKTVGCAYESESGAHQFERTITAPAALERLVQEVKPDRVVIEVCSIAGWVCDLMGRLGIEVQVANTSDEAWRWRKVKQKDDRRDALKAARLSAVNQLREVYIPQIEVRQWRALIYLRATPGGRRTKIKNHIRDLLVREGQILPRGSRCWNKLGQELLSSMARPLTEVSAAELWRGELWEELQQLQMIQARIASEEKLDAIGEADKRVQLLRTIPGVGPRLAEAIVALLDQPQRFRKASQVSGYIGMVPKAFDSGESERRGHKYEPQALIPWSQVHRKALKRLVTAPLHHATGVVAGDFHPVCDCSVPEAVAGKTVRLAVFELGDSAGIPTGSRYRIVIGGCFGSCEQVTVARETFADAGLHDLADCAPKRYVALVLRLCGFQSNEALAPMKLIETQSQDLIQASTCLPQQPNGISRITPNRQPFGFA